MWRKDGFNGRDHFLRNEGSLFMNRILASVNIFVEPSQKEHVVAALSELNSIEEIYEVAGEYDIVSLVSASSLEEFRDVLQKKIMKIEGIKSTVSSIVLKPYKGPKCQIKPGLPAETIF